jgi:hypothetical protein
VEEREESVRQQGYLDYQHRDEEVDGNDFGVVLFGTNHGFVCICKDYGRFDWTKKEEQR